MASHGVHFTHVLLYEARSAAAVLLGAVIAKVSWTSHTGVFLLLGFAETWQPHPQGGACFDLC